MKSTSNAEFQVAMKKRTKDFALRVIKVVDALPNRKVCWDLGRQLLRAGTSVGANYRAACRARSVAEFRAKLGIVEEEADEAIYWMELLVDSNYMKLNRLESLIQEADEILRITVSAIKSSADAEKPRRITKPVKKKG